jgi:hypothetical protein
LNTECVVGYFPHFTREKMKLREIVFSREQSSDLNPGLFPVYPIAIYPNRY